MRDRDLYEDTPALLWAIAADGTLLRVSHHWRTTLGYGDAPVVGQSALNFIATGDRVVIAQRLRQSWQGAVSPQPCALVAADGGLHPVTFQVNAVRDEAGEPLYQAVAMQAVAPVAALPAVAIAEPALQRYMHMVEASTDAICLTDRDYRYQIINHTYREWYGYGDRPIVGQTVAEVLGVDVFEQRLRPQLERCLAGETIRYAQWFDFPHLGRRFRSVTCTPYREPNGEITGILTSIRDLTDLKLAEDGQQELLEILESTTDFIGMATVDGRPTYLNPSLKAFLGYGPGTTVDTLNLGHFRDFHPPAVADFILATGIPAAIAQGTWHGETALLSPQGEVVPISQTITAHRNQDGQVVLLSTIGRDMRTLKRLEHSLQTIIQGTAAVIGEDFFPVLADYLAQALGVAHVIVSEWIEPDRLHPLACWSHGQAAVCTPYAIANTPCRHTLQLGYYACPEGLQAAFPADQDLVELGVDSYLGVTLNSRGGEVLGEICILHTQPLGAVEEARHILQIFADRAAAELERQRTDRALRQSEALNRAIIQALPDLVMRLRRDGQCLDVQYPSGFPALQLRRRHINRPLAEIIGPDLAAQRLHYVERALHTGQPQVYEFQIAVGDQPRWEEARIVPLGADEVLVLVRNIHDRKQAEQEVQRLNQMLQAQNQQLEALVAQRTAELTTFMNALPDQIFVVDRAGTMPFGNDAVAAAAGCDRETFQGQRVVDLFGPAQAAYYMAQNQQVFETGETLHVEEAMETPNGLIYVDTYKIPLKHPNGEVYGLIGTSRNITERVRAREALAAQTAQLEATNRELEAFSYSVSHDLRAPLRHIDGFIAALSEHLAPVLAADTQAAHYMDRIHHASRRMAQLIEGLLTLSRVGRQTLRRRPVNLNDLVPSVLGLLNLDTTDACQITLEPLPTVAGDSTLIQQVFANLLENAVKFSRDRTPARITIGCQADGPLYVQDNGVGFDMAYADKLFTPFQRLHSTTAFPGTGIGLAIVQRIIHRHQGRIWVDSAPDQGTTVFFTLAAAEPTPSD